MHCPRCQSPIEHRTTGEIAVPTCPACNGMLLRRGELNRIAEPTSGDLEFSTLHEDSHGHDDSFGPIACPECQRAPMEKVEFNIHTGIILDHCTGCGAFWLDGPEMERINAEVRDLNEASDDDDPPMLWFARFIWTLPR